MCGKQNKRERKKGKENRRGTENGTRRGSEEDKRFTKENILQKQTL